MLAGRPEEGRDGGEDPGRALLLRVRALAVCLLCAVVAVAAPVAWAPALLVMAASLSLAAVRLPVAGVVPVVAGAVAAAGVASALTQDAGTAVVGTLGFGGAAVLATFPVAHLATRRAALLAEHLDLVEHVDAIVWWLEDGAAAYGSMSGSASRMLGYPTVRLAEVAFWVERIHPDDRPAVEGARRDVLRTGGRAEVDYRLRDGEGRWRWLREVLTAERPAGGGAVRLRGLTIDVSDRHEVEEEGRRYHAVVDRIATAIVTAELRPGTEALVVASANPAAAQLFGRSAGELVGVPLTDLLTPSDDSVTQRARSVAEGGPGFTVERLENVGIDRQRTFTLRAFGLPDGGVGLALEDVTGATMVAAALRRQALTDGLTGLPNRTLLRDRLRFALADAKRRDERVALILLDLNHFKEVNDALGHQYGDRLLTAFAKRLQELLRECDTIARLGGDEFALLLTRATNEGASRVVQKITEAMQEPFVLDGVTVQAHASLGVALYPDHAEDADLLTQRADVAMYSAKHSGGGWSIYSPAQDTSSIERLTLLSDLHAELDDGRPATLTTHYQPLLDLASGRIVGAEALLRWPHPGSGWLNPELVVELAELSGLIGPLARFVTRDATATIAGLRSGGLDLTVAVNLSARNLYDRSLTRWLSEAIGAAGLPPEAVKVELTESEVMDDPVLAMDVVSRLGELGIGTSIDDFGTGYSSLSYLRRLPVDEIKIDRSFVLTMTEDANDRTIVRSVIDLAHNLGKRVVAEGVEDEATLDALRGYGCDRAQGYLIGRPMPADALADLVRGWDGPGRVGAPAPVAGRRLPGAGGAWPDEATGR